MSAANRYNYSVEFTGVGNFTNMSHNETIGHCSQIAIFRKLPQPLTIPNNTAICTLTSNATDTSTTTSTSIITSTSSILISKTPHSQAYHLVATIHFPYFDSTSYTNDDILTQIKKQTEDIIYLDQYDSIISPDSNGKEVLPMGRQAPFNISIKRYWSSLAIRQFCKTIDGFKSFVKTEGESHFKLSHDEMDVIVLKDVPPMKSMDQQMNSQGNEEQEQERDERYDYDFNHYNYSMGHDDDIDNNNIMNEWSSDDMDGSLTYDEDLHSYQRDMDDVIAVSESRGENHQCKEEVAFIYSGWDANDVSTSTATNIKWV